MICSDVYSAEQQYSDGVHIIMHYIIYNNTVMECILYYYIYNNTVMECILYYYIYNNTVMEFIAHSLAYLGEISATESLGDLGNVAQVHILRDTWIQEHTL